MEFLNEFIYKDSVNHALFALCLFFLICIWALNKLRNPNDDPPITEKKLLKIIKKEPELKPHLINFDGVLTIAAVDSIRAKLEAEKITRENEENMNKTIQAQKQVLKDTL